ncbi:MAG: DegV family protein [Oscillospiraceae bacterium]|nr:DegV family protein [Oscillospiraceae bacterium]
MKVTISSDSTCDLPPELLQRYGIRIAPLFIIKDETQYRDGIDITPADVFEYVESGAGMTHSSALNVADYLGYFGEWLKDCDALVHICIGSHFSSCYDFARLAAEELQNVYIIDSANLSSGSGLLVLEAAMMAEAGTAPGDIVEEIIKLIPRVEASFVIGNIKYLYLGGRCSGLAALGANLLRLNPCIEVIDGKMHVGKKYRGSFEKALMQYISDRLSNRGDLDRKRIFVTFPPGIPEDLVSRSAEKIKSFFDFEEIVISEAGCVISNHCGPICLGILFFRST